jgi:hypothetical protein
MYHGVGHPSCELGMAHAAGWLLIDLCCYTVNVDEAEDARQSRFCVSRNVSFNL